MQPNDKERKRSTLQSFFRSSFKKKKFDTTASHTDELSQATESDITICCSTNEPLELVTSSSSISSPSSVTSSSLSPSTLTSSFSTTTETSLSLSPSTLSSSFLTTTETLSSLSPSTLTSSFSTTTATSPCSSSTSPPSARLAATNISRPSDISISAKEPPTQPKLASYKTNKDDRSFHAQWFGSFPWLEYSIEQDRVFCYYCRHFNDASNFVNRNRSDAFTSGYCNWKNAMTKTQGFRKHEVSVSHKFATSNYQQFVLRTNSQTTVKDVLDKGRIELIRKNRQRLSKIASAILLCAKQSIALRGHDENDLSNNRGNFIEILKWAASTDPIVNSIFADSSNNASYLSPPIQNELIQHMADQIRFQIAEKVSSFYPSQINSTVAIPNLFLKIHGRVFALMADEAKDCSGNQQLSIVLRYVSDDPVNDKENADHSSIFKEHLLGLVKLNEFDANTLKNVNPTSIKKWSNIRWDSRWSSINSLLQNYKAILITLQELEEEGSERSIDARGLILAIKVPIFVVSLIVVHKVFGIIKVLSDQLKAKSIDFTKAQCLIKSVVTQIGDLRNEKEFSIIYLQIENFCEEHDISLSATPRVRRTTSLSSRFKDAFLTCSVGQRVQLNNEDQYRTNLFYPFIDSILIELNDRFSSENMEILNGISALCPDHDNFLDHSLLKAFAIQLKVDLCSLYNELQVLKPMLKKLSLKTIVDLYTEILPLKNAFPTVIHIVVAAMTIPVSSTTCERSYSRMKLIKTTTRNTMSDSRLSDLCVLAVEREFNVDLEKLVDNFADAHKNRRLLLK
ncbi:unnamed protein product [Adineta steineri]|uniref:TTF-type domain-containing protein n=1 Tax=Adineta steineri TaxID=433720 RepID=A0A813N4J7_9BILA|nr:unnamed protein product [Adineta steineri]